MRSDAARLVHIHADTIARVAYGMLGHPHDAEDICHDVLLSAMEYEGKWESPEHERAWIIRVTINHCRNLLGRSERRLTDSWEDIAQFSGHTEAVDSLPLPNTADCLHEAISLLTPPQREAILLRYWAGYPVKDIAVLLGTSPTSVSMRLARAREVLRAALEGGSYA